MAAMALTEKQLAELEKVGMAVVQIRLAQQSFGRAAVLRGFATGELPRGYVEDWMVKKLAAQERQQAEHRTEAMRLARSASQQQTETLRWAKIAGWAAIVAVGLGIVVPLLQWLPTK
jgi:hypothetical protein